MPNITRYPNQFFEPTPIHLVEWVLGLRRQAPGAAGPRLPEPVPASGLISRPDQRPVPPDNAAPDSSAA